jgi:rod shape-determining protein MreD
VVARRLNPSLFAGLILLPTLTLVQVSLAQHLVIAGAYPNLALLAVVDWGIIRGVEEGMLWGLMGGIFIDLYSGLPFGTSSLAFVLIAGLISLGEGTLMRTNVLLPFLTVIGATLLYYAVAIFMFASFRHVLLVDQHTLHTIFAEALYNGVLNPFAFSLLQAFDRKLHPVARANW